MYEAGETKRADRSELLDEDELDQLRSNYGDRSTLKYLNFRAAVLLAKLNVSVTCKTAAFSNNLAFWSWKRSVPPTGAQLDRFERYYSCQETEPENSKRRGGKGKESGEVQNVGLKRLKEILSSSIRALGQGALREAQG